MKNPLADKYAVVAMGGIYPDAQNADEYWQNIISKKCSIKEISNRRLDKETYYRPELISSSAKEDKSYTQISATIEDLNFNPREFRIPPMVANHMDLNQKATLLAAKEAISSGTLESVDKSRVSVFMGNTMLSEIHHDFHKRMNFDYFCTNLNKVSSFTEAIDPLVQAGIIAEVKERALQDTQMITEDSAPGVLPNIIASRICSVFDLHGHAFVIDAACASSLATVICGIQQLKLGEADAVICGGSDMQSRETGMVYFSGINALSQKGSYPFDARADGFVIGMGAGLVIIKRLADAIKADDQILSVITGYGQASDGKGKAIAAPNPEWQAKTIIKAYEMAGYSPETVEFIEAHGTSTKVGDASEVAALKEVYRHFNATQKQSCGLSSVKSNIGHLKSAAGIAGVMKVIHALDKKVLPPVAEFKEENPNLNLANSPFYVIDEARSWPAKEHPRRAGVSAFGFGGADYHIAFEEFRKEDYNHLPASFYNADTEDVATKRVPETNHVETLFCGGTSAKEIHKTLNALHQKLSQSKDRSTTLYKHNLLADAKAPCRFACTFSSLDDLREKITLFERGIEDQQKQKQLSLRGISFSEKSPLKSEQMTCMFPGQGSQYADMQRDLVDHYLPAQKVCSRADAIWEKETGHSVTELIASSPEGIEKTNTRLKAPENTHPTLLMTGLATFETLRAMQVTPAITIGHSAGELVALCAAGALSHKAAFELMHKRAQAFTKVSVEGTMLALALSAEKTQTLLKNQASPLTIANSNSPKQTIVSGSEEAIEALLTHCGENSIRATKIPVSRAFHSPLMKEAQEDFKKALEKTHFTKPAIAVIANESNDYYGQSDGEITTKLQSQICGSVNFAGSIQKLYEEGIRLFVETGPNRVLSSLVQDILADKEDVIILNADQKKGSSLAAFQQMLGGLFTAGIPVDLLPSTGKKVFNAPQKKRPIPPKEKIATAKETIVYSGVSAGLPGSFKKSFRDDNFEQLFEGRNQIERLTDSEMESLVDLRVSKLMKSEKGANFVLLDTLNQVIQLAGKVGQIDLLADYAIDGKEIRNMSSAIALAVAAGYEALRDAQIPLIREYTQTNSGATLPERWALPQEMQKDTGIIFANGFPMIDPIIAEVSRHISYKLGSKLKEEIFDFYHELIGRVSDRESKKLLTDWYALNHSRLSETPTEEEVYTFNHHLMNQLASQANNRLAQYINAQGPNFQINAACSSTATAITLSQELIHSGRVKRMIVIGADDAGTKHSLPYVGAGFLSTGACSNEGDLYEAALPFDKRRKGMIMGAGAVGFVVESENSCVHRGVTPVCELVGSHVFNTAGHHSALDVPRYAEELEIFMKRMEQENGFDRQGLAKEMLYLSHETYTPARGGCSESEAVSLRHVFGDTFREIEVSNTKGMTGHTMGASIEDAAAAKALQFGKVPPVVNHKVADPALEGLKLSNGGSHNRTYALRMAAGFGSQGNYLLLKKRATGNNRIAHPERYAEWLSSISGLENPELSIEGRRLLIKDMKPGTIIVQRPAIGKEALRNSVALAAQQEKAAPQHVEKTQNPKQTVPAKAPAPAKKAAVDHSREVLSVIAEVTGYDQSMLELDMEVEADLGVDTVKQATILAMLGEQFGHNEEEGFRISEFPTIGHIVELFNTATPTDEIEQQTQSSEVELAQSSAPQNNVTPQVLAVIAEVTGYDQSMLELDMEVEADLGVDTVKQATILAMLGEQFGHNEEEGFRISEFPTIGHIVELFNTATPTDEAEQQTQSSKVELAQPSAPQNNVTPQVLAIIAEVTGYDQSMLELDMEVEADLGVDTVKQATILAMLGEQFGHNEEEGFRISEFPTIGHIVTLFSGSQIQEQMQLSDALPPQENSVNKVVEVVMQGEQIEGVVLSPTGKIPSHRTTAEPLSPEETVLQIITENSDYVEEMLLPEFSLLDDLKLTPQQCTEIAKGLSTILGETLVLSKDETVATLIGKISPLMGNGIPGFVENNIDMARQILRLQETPLAEQTVSLHEKSILLVGDDSSTIEAIAKELSSASVTTLCIPTSGDLKEMQQTIKRVVPGRTFHIMIDLTTLGLSDSFLSQEPEQIISRMQRLADCRFSLCKHLLTTETVPGRVLAVTALDGSFGITKTGKTIDPLYGLSLGFYKGLRKEWIEQSRVTLLDIHPNDLKNAQTLTKRLLNELGSNSAGVEVCYDEDKRQTLVVDDHSYDRREIVKSLSLSPNDTIIAAGAGAGITAHVLIELMRKMPCKVVITGRSHLLPNVEHYAALSGEQLQEQKCEIKEHLQNRGERVTPVKIEKEFAHITKSIEIYQTIETLRSLGCTVLYEACDIRDNNRMSAIVQKTKEHLGPISGIIHGAGVEISRPMAQKSSDEFHLVHSIKSLGALNLSHLCKDEPLKFVTAFSSISGRFGNAAQLDYSTGNEFLNLWARMYNQQSNILAISLIWSGWAETGMAWRNSFVKEHAEYMGLHLIDPQDGASAAVREIITNSGCAEVCLNKGLGAMQEKEMSHFDFSPLPMIDRIQRNGDKISQAHRVFSVNRDALLNNHRIAGTPLMPGVGFMEMMAETYTLLEKKSGPFIFRHVKFPEAFKLYRDESRPVFLNIKPTENQGAWAMDVMAPFKSRLAKEPTVIKYSEATIAVEAPDLTNLNPKEWDFSGAENHHYSYLDSFGKNFGNNVELGAILDDCKREQTSESSVFTFNNSCYKRKVRFPIAQFTTDDYPVDQYLINPAFLDTLHQAGAIYSIFSKKEVYLPYGAEEFGVLKPMRSDEMYDVYVQRISEEGDTILYNIVLCNETGETTAYIRGSLFHRINQ